MTTTTKTLAPTLRWALRHHVPGILKVEQSQSYPRSQEQVVYTLNQRKTNTIVALVDEQVKGYMTYDVFKRVYNLSRIVVHPGLARREIGSAMVRNLISKLNSEKRTRIFAEVRERNLTAQLFFKRLGFRAIQILPKHYLDSGEDAYVFQYQMGGSL